MEDKAIGWADNIFDIGACRWDEARQWNARHADFAAAHGRRRRVLVRGRGDLFGAAMPEPLREKLLAVIGDTPELDWLLLTARSDEAEAALPDRWLEQHPNAWLGVRAGTQDDVERQLPALARLPAAVRFLVLEPLLAPVDLLRWLDPWSCSNCGFHGSIQDSGPCRCDACDIATRYDEKAGSDRCPTCAHTDCDKSYIGVTCPKCGCAEGWGRDCGFRFDSQRPCLLDWIIVGGGANPLHPDWARRLRDQCAEAAVPFMFSRWGEWFTATRRGGQPVFRQFANFREWMRGGGLHPHHGVCLDREGQPVEGATMVRAAAARGRFPLTIMHRIGRQAAGRLLDGQLHDAAPKQRR